MLDIAARIVVFVAGSAIVIGTVLSAVRTFVLPRSSPTILTRVIFLTMRDLFSIFEKRVASYEQRDRILALYAPLSLPLQRICDFFALPYNPHPAPSDTISVTREEFDAACERLADAGVPLKPDREKAWRDFSGWRVNYDTPLLLLASTVTAPLALWSSDRAPARRCPPTFLRGK
ncbi:MAG: hypothetical protein M3R61_01570 [Chloroflexota bacterium]|nr:hypothetical protein [Chloroflexota bacterium]